MIEEVLKFAREYVNKPAARTPERKRQIAETLKALTGEKVKTSCGTCYMEALFKILNLTKMSGKYELKKGVVLQAFGHPEKTCTNLTLTDEIGDWYMANFPSKAIYFARIPVAVPPIQIVPPTKVIEPEKKPEVFQPESVFKNTLDEISGVKEEKKPGRKPKK